MLQGLMQDRPLLISSLIEHAATFHPDTEIVSRLPEGPVHRTTWKGICLQARQVANAMHALGVKQGDRVGTLAWNSYRHLVLRGVGLWCGVAHREPTFVPRAD
jgi:fatty-acyl-CoA synthase